MKCLFNNTKVTTNEEYKEVVKSKIKMFIVIMILGMITVAISIVNEAAHIIAVPDFMNGVYTGMGSGLIAAGMLLMLKNMKLLKDEAALKKSRLKNQDERNILISQNAIKGAAMVVMVCSYIGMLIIGFFSKAVCLSFWSVVMIFLVAYLFFSFYFNKKL